MRLPQRHRYDFAVAIGALIGLAVSYFLLSDRNILLAAIAFDLGLLICLPAVRLLFRSDEAEPATSLANGSSRGAEIVNLTSDVRSREVHDEQSTAEAFRNAA